MSIAIAPSIAAHLVGMGQIAIFSPPETARAVLGSCVGVALYDELAQVAALAHVVLPKSEGRAAATPGKFADTAIASMRESLLARGSNPSRIRAKIAGGADMFVGKGPFQIGVQNIEAVKSGLRALGIRLLGEHLGGTQGRRITFDLRTSKLAIEVTGQPAVHL